MNSISIKEARQNIAMLIQTAENGGTVTITRRGKPVARLCPIAPERQQILPDLAEFRASIRLKGMGLSTTVSELRRQERY